MSAKESDVTTFHGVQASERLPEQAHVGAVHLQISGSAALARVLPGRARHGRARTRCRSRVARRERWSPPSGAPRGEARCRAGAAARQIRLVSLRPCSCPTGGRSGIFAAHLLRLGLRPGMADHAVSEALYLSDPDGLGIEVYADRPRASWTYRGDELVMTTEPLDIAGLMAANQGGEWGGAPEGTSMGHVHLHVGDLARAEAFYHSALGFDKRVWSYPGALFLSAGGYHHHVGTNIWSSGPSARADEARLLEWELVVPEHGAYQRRRAKAACRWLRRRRCTRWRADVRRLGNPGVCQIGDDSLSKIEVDESEPDRIQACSSRRLECGWIGLREIAVIDRPRLERFERAGFIDVDHRVKLF